jgi:hypothetical protein
MKKFICSILSIVFFSNVSFATCDFSTGIKPNSDGTYNYSKDCHIEVGNMKKENQEDLLKIQKLTDAISYKDIALQKSEERIDLWQNQAFKLEDRIDNIDKLKSKNETLYFILGVFVTGVAIYAGSKVTR